MESVAGVLIMLKSGKKSVLQTTTLESSLGEIGAPPQLQACQPVKLRNAEFIAVE